MRRISREEMFIDHARVSSRRSTCSRLAVGAVLTVDNNIVSQGYNGPASGEPHCQGNDCKLSPTGGCSRSLHAEYNAIHRSNYQYLSRSKLFCTHQPCLDCAKEIVAYKIPVVVFEHSYRKDDGLLLLLDKGVKVYRIANGFLTDMKTNRIVNETPIL